MSFKTRLKLTITLLVGCALVGFLTGNCFAKASDKPNILVILADDMGFSDTGCYGGEIKTPNIDRLASEGIRFTQFYNTARCWPTRSCLLSGYYPQSIRMDPPHGRLPKWTRLLPHYLKPAGYRCYHSGKWHVNGAPKACADGGFDHSYLLDDHNRYFAPQKHSEDDKPLPPVGPGTNFYVTTFIADEAIKFLREHARDHAQEPFFSYVAFTSPHFPVQAPASDIARYADTYLKGWDEVRDARWKRLREMGIVNCNLAALDPTLTPRYFKNKVMEQLGPGEVNHAEPWNTLNDEQKKFQASKMAVHAAMVDRMDQEIGRILDQLRAMNALDNTVIFFLSDNGADATLLVRGDGNDRTAPPGSAKSFLCIGPGWASASNAPFRRHKIWVNEGGISTPLIVHWPNKIKAHGDLRRDMGHVIDLAPTILDLAGARISKEWNGVTAPALPGKSLVPDFRSDGHVKHDFLFFDHEGNRALRVGNWKLVSASEDLNRWELFDLSKDRCEAVDLAGKYPERLKQMEVQWKKLESEYQKLGESP